MVSGMHVEIYLELYLHCSAVSQQFDLLPLKANFWRYLTTEGIENAHLGWKESQTLVLCQNTEEDVQEFS